MVNRRWFVFCLLLLTLPHAVWAMSVSAQNAETMEVDALQCWRRIGANAVHVGERFAMTLTCAVVETNEARAAPDLAWLEPETLTVSPFEVLEGQRYQDIVRGSRRFFQYRYELRIIGEDYFGLDVELPALEIRYRIERALDGGALVEGRELTYFLPAESVRVLALVPAAVTDIRELPGETFGDVEGRLFRANATGILATVLAGLAGIVLLLAVVRARRDWQVSAVKVDRCVSSWDVARAAVGELTRVQAASEVEGWSRDLVGRALTVFRLAGALILEQPVSQMAQLDEASEADCESRLYVRSWPFGGTEALVFSAMTVRRIESALPIIRYDRPEDERFLETIHKALKNFTTAQYTSDGFEPARLSDDVERSVEVLSVLRRRTLPPVWAVTEARRTLLQWVNRRWPR
jgi:hypothetical protein